jgi:ketosteroid isomerase-like protein
MQEIRTDPWYVKGEFMSDAEQEIREWLQAFDSAVRDVDYERGKTLFADDVVGFGTYASMLEGLKNLVEGQWKNIWGVTRGFTFRLGEAHIGVEGDLAWVASPWDSQGQNEDGTWFSRPGRATIILERRDGVWLARHTHLSLYPR